MARWGTGNRSSARETLSISEVSRFSICSTISGIFATAISCRTISATVRAAWPVPKVSEQGKLLPSESANCARCGSLSEFENSELSRRFGPSESAAENRFLSSNVDGRARRACATCQSVGLPSCAIRPSSSRTALSRRSGTNSTGPDGIVGAAVARSIESDIRQPVNTRRPAGRFTTVRRGPCDGERGAQEIRVRPGRDE
jgi:hypothetical protein